MGDPFIYAMSPSPHGRVGTLDSLRQRAQEIFEKELLCYDEDRVKGGDPAVYRAAAERVWRELGGEILQLLLD